MPISMRHNMAAAQVANTLTSQFQELATSTRRLSSGLRIEESADDPAGLAVRELMRADISALNQGVRNANDAISLIQTMDGALGIIEEKLIRMKELAEQAATGTYDSVQRLMIDSEFQAMGSEITRIALATDFNGIKLLAGANAGGAAGVNQVLAAQWDFNDLSDSSGNGNALSSTGTLFVGGGALTTVAVTPGTASANINLAGTEGFSLSLDFSANPGDNGGGGVSVFTYNNLSAFVDNFGVLEVSVGGQNIQSAQWAIGVNAPTSLEVRIEADKALHVILNGNDIGRIANANVGGPGQLVLGNPTGTEGSITYTSVNARQDANAGQGGGGGNGGDAAVDGDPAPGRVLIHFGTGNDSAEDYYVIDKSDATLNGLGIADADVTTQTNAQTSLTRIEDALVRHAEIRTYLGGLQNRLENTVSNLTIQSENTAASESRISDVDVAQEMQTFIRNQVLTQSAVSMLTQANSMPRMVMSLIF